MAGDHVVRVSACAHPLADVKRPGEIADQWDLYISNSSVLTVLYLVMVGLSTALGASCVSELGCEGLTVCLTGGLCCLPSLGCCEVWTSKEVFVLACMNLWVHEYSAVKASSGAGTGTPRSGFPRSQRPRQVG